MLRLRNFTAIFSALNKRIVPFQALSHVSAYNFARINSVTMKKKIKELTEEAQGREEMMEEMHKNQQEAEEGSQEESEDERIPELEDEDDLESKEMFDQLQSKEFDKKLDKLIEQKMAEGKSHEEIVNEFFGVGTKKSRRKQKIPDEDEEEKSIEEEKNFFFDDKSTILAGLTQNPTPGQARAQRRLVSELENMETLTEILGDAKDEPLSELGRSELKRMGNRLTKQEKSNFALKQAMLQSQILASSSKPPESLEPQLLLKDKEVFEELDFAKERQLQNRASVNLDILPDHEPGLPPRVLETKEEKRIRLKVEGGLIESKRKEDLEFRKDAKTDLAEAAEELGMTLHEEKTGDSRLAHVEVDLGPTVYEKVEKKIAAFIKEFDLDPELTKEMVKEELFRLKKLDEQNQRLKEIAKKKEKKKKIAKLVDELQELEIEKGIDFDKEDEDDALMNELSKKKFLTAEDLDKIKDKDIMTKHDPLDIPEERGYEIHRMRTQRNIEEYLPNLMGSNNQRIMQGVNKGIPISVVEVVLNKALTVINVFWIATDHHNNRYDKNDKTIETLERNLAKFAGWARGKLCRDLQFKYAPELRFFYSERGQTYEEMRYEHEKTATGILKQRMKEEIEKGSVKTKKDYQKKELVIEEEIEESFFEYTKQYTHKELLKTNKPKFNEEGVRIRDNRTPDGKKKKFQRENKGKKFWDSLN